MRSRVACSLLLAGGLLPACTGGSPTPDQPAEAPSATATPARGGEGTLKLFYWQAPTTLNPHLSSGTKDLSASRLVYEPLASFDADGRMVPLLAAGVPSSDDGSVAADGRSVTWRLRRDVVWSDGQPFTAEDVKFTFDYITDPDVGSTSTSNYATVERVEAVDPHTARVHFTQVNPDWSTPFTGVQGMILPKHVFQRFTGPGAAEAPPNTAPVGTGPYRVAEFSTEDVLVVGNEAVRATRIRYEPNSRYRVPGKPHFDVVELRGGGGDASFASQLIRDGASDFAWNVAVDDKKLADMEAAGHRAIIDFGAFVERIMFNFTDPRRQTPDGERSSTRFPHPFLTDRRVRQAIAHAVDRERIARNYGRGGRLADNLVVLPQIYRSQARPLPYDLAAARRLLDAAGWGDRDGDGVREKGRVPLRVVFQTSVNPVRQQTQAIVKRSLESIGVRVDLKNIDSGIFLGPPAGTTNTRRQFYADLEMFAFSNKSPDPGAYLEGWTCREAAQKANNWARANWARYCNPAYDRLYARSATELDAQTRVGLLRDLDRMLIEDVALIPLVNQSLVSGVNRALGGVAPTPWDVEPWNIADWRRT